MRKSTKFVFEFCGLGPIGRLALVDTATLSCFNHDFLGLFRASPLLFSYNDVFTKNFSAILRLRKKIVGNPLHIHLIEIVMQTFWWESLRGWDCRPQLVVVSGLFSVGIPSWMGFFRPQLVVVSGLFGGNPFVDGIVGHNLLLSLAYFLYDRIQAIMKPLS
jgi:hypothetical protein